MTKTNISEDANAYVGSGASDVLNSYGRTTIPAQMNGEGLESTPYMNAVGMARTGVTMPSGRVWSEPGVPFSGSTRGAVWHATYGGSYIEVGGAQNSEFVNILHRSGSRITIAPDGSVTISSSGDIVLTSDENSVEVFDGAKEGVYRAGYAVSVSGGKTIINSASSIELVSGQDINLSAGGAINLNAGNGIDLSSTRIAISAKVDTLDLYSEGKLSMQSQTQGHLKFGEGLYAGAKSVHITSSEGTLVAGKALSLSGSDNVKVGGSKISLKGGSAVAMNAGQIHLNSTTAADEPDAPEAALSANISALGAPPAHTVDIELPVTYSAGGITAADVDESFTE